MGFGSSHVDEPLVVKKPPFLKELRKAILKEQTHFYAEKLPCVNFIAQSGKGKNQILFEIFARTRDQWTGGLTFSKVHTKGDSYSRMFPETFIYLSLSAELIKKLTDRQVIFISKYKGDKELSKIMNPQMSVVLDDIIDETTRYIKGIGDLAKNLRHLECGVFVLGHGYTEIPKGIRQNAHIQFFGPNKPGPVQEIYEGVFKQLFANEIKMFRKFYSTYTADFGFIVRLTFSKNDDETNRFRLVYYREPDDLFRMGSAEFWFAGLRFALNNKNLLQENVVWEETDDPEDEDEENAANSFHMLTKKHSTTAAKLKSNQKRTHIQHSETKSGATFGLEMPNDFKDLLEEDTDAFFSDNL